MVRVVVLILVLMLPTMAAAQSPVSCEEEKRAFDLLIGHIRGQRNGFELDVARHLTKLERDIAALEATNRALKEENATLKKSKGTPAATPKEPTNP